MTSMAKKKKIINFNKSSEITLMNSINESYFCLLNSEEDTVYLIKIVCVRECLSDGKCFGSTK